MAAMDSPLDNALRKAAASIRADFESSASVNHRGARGRVRERIVVEQFIRKYLPPTVAISHSGEVIDSEGGVSPECDILVYDPSAPVLYSDETYRIVPNECCYGVIEVKSTLDSKELRTSLDNIRRIKSMPKTAFRELRHVDGAPLQKFRDIYGRRWNVFPNAGFIFAYDSIDLRTLARTFAEHTSGWAITEVPDAIFVLDRGIIMWTSRDGQTLSAAAEPEYGLQVLAKRKNSDDILLWMTMTLNDFFSVAFMPAALDFRMYLARSHSDLWAQMRVYYDGTEVEQRFDPDGTMSN